MIDGAIYNAIHVTLCRGFIDNNNNAPMVFRVPSSKARTCTTMARRVIFPDTTATCCGLQYSHEDNDRRQWWSNDFVLGGGGSQPGIFTIAIREHGITILVRF